MRKKVDLLISSQLHRHLLAWHVYYSICIYFYGVNENHFSKMVRKKQSSCPLPLVLPDPSTASCSLHIFQSVYVLLQAQGDARASSLFSPSEGILWISGLHKRKFHWLKCSQWRPQRGSRALNPSAQRPLWMGRCHRWFSSSRQADYG